MNHSAFDRTPYTYLIRHKPSGLLYYGSRYAKGCNPSDLWTSYFTSSDYVAELIERDGVDSFSFEIRKIFNVISDCLRWEERVLKRVYLSDKYLNRNCAGAIRPMSGPDNPMFGKERPDAVERMKANNPMKNKSVALRVSETLKERYASGELQPHRPSEEEAQATSDRMKANNPMKDKSVSTKMQATIRQKYGKHHSSGSIWLANKITKKRKRISLDDLHLYLETDGWIRLSNKYPIPD